jgi:steroid 5-alpha reductase family enzyme
MVYLEAPEPRVLVMAILISLWGARLTYNFSRRGGYSWRFWTGEEDYRWAVLRAKPEFQAPWKWIAFNLFFISFYQMSLIWMMTTPTIKSVGGGALSVVDYILAAAAMGFLVIETVADQQQWDYQEEKHRRKKTGEVLGPKYEKGFTHHGLWSIMRHPNYFGEQAFWVVIYLFSVSATGTLVNWSIAGCLLLVLLFKGSSDFSEEISSSKYPDYKEYMKQVPRFLPWPGRKYR